VPSRRRTPHWRPCVCKRTDGVYRRRYSPRLPAPKRVTEGVAGPVRQGPVGPNLQKGKPMSLGTIVLIVVILMLVGALPTWPHARSWGYGPSGLLGVVLVVVLVLFLMGRL
jgi:hypothetical protein